MRLTSRNGDFHSCDPLDRFSDPLDHTNENGDFDVRKLRERLNLTQQQFASWFGFPVATLRHWERGNRKPSGTALVLNVIRENPRAVRLAVRKTRFASRIARKSHRAPAGLRRRY